MEKDNLQAITCVPFLTISFSYLRQREANCKHNTTYTIRQTAAGAKRRASKAIGPPVSNHWLLKGLKQNIFHYYAKIWAEWNSERLCSLESWVKPDDIMPVISCFQTYWNVWQYSKANKRNFGKLKHNIAASISVFYADIFIITIP